MELLYVLIEKSYHGIFEMQGLNFSKEYDIDYRTEDNKVRVEKRKFANIYSDNIYNISAIVGQNGCGKSTLLYSLRDYHSNGNDELKIHWIFGEANNIYYLSELWNDGSFIGDEELISKICKYGLRQNNGITVFYYSHLLMHQKRFNSSFNNNGVDFKYVCDHSNAHVYNNLMNETFLRMQQTDRNSELEQMEEYDKLVILLLISLNGDYIQRFVGEKVQFINIDNISNSKLDRYKRDYYDNGKEEQLDKFNEIFTPLENKYVKKCKAIVSQRKDLKIQIKNNLIIGCFADVYLHLFSTIDLYKEKIDGECPNLEIEIDTVSVNVFDNLIARVDEIFAYFGGFNSIQGSIKKVISNYDELYKMADTVNVRVNSKIIGDEEYVLSEFIIIDSNFKNFVLKYIESGIRQCFVFDYCDSDGNVKYFSSGEYSIMSLISRINLLLYPLHEMGPNSMSAFNKARDKSILILLDEPDTNLHPEWNRKLINELNNYIELAFSDDYLIQFIITTNSPYMLTDIPKESILTINETANGKLTVENCKLNSFGSNIHLLLKDTFFMRSTIGEFAKGKIQAVFNFLTIDNYEGKIDKTQAEYIIETIGDPLIKNKLQSLFMNKFDTDKDQLIKGYIDKIDQLNNRINSGLVLDKAQVSAFQKKLSDTLAMINEFDGDGND